MKIGLSDDSGEGGDQVANAVAVVKFCHVG
jgi:hypothetical protein